MIARLKGLSVRIIFSLRLMVICGFGLLPNPAKVPKFKYTAWWYSIVQKFHNEGKKIQESQFWVYFGLRPWSGQSPKISKLGMMVFYRLEILYWWLKIIFYFFSCPVTDQQPKNVLPIFVATRYFLFILIFLFFWIKWNGHFQSSLLGKLQGIVYDKFYFSFSTIKEDSKKQKSLNVCAVV
jgi:hypothetical protein